MNNSSQYGLEQADNLSPARPRSNDGNVNDAESWSGNESANGDEDGEDPPRKRKRPMSVSCELCKQRKVKCDRGQPSCGWCVRNSQLCEYRERKKPGLRAGYGKELEARLDRLEDMLQRQQGSINQLTNFAIQQQSPAQQDGPVFRSPPIMQPPHVPRAETALFLRKPPVFTAQAPSMVPEFNGNLGVQTPITSNETFPQNLSSPSAAQPSPNGINATQGFPNSNPRLGSPSVQTNLSAQTQLSVQEQDFPPYDLLYTLVDLYFKHVNTWCPILHRRTTIESLFGPSTLDEADRILLHAIVATTLRFSVDKRLTPESRERYHETSKQKVLLYGLENSSVRSLQALVILVLDLIGFSNGPPGWNLLALITRSVVQLGIAVETTSSMVSPQYPSIYTLRAMVLPDPKDWIEEESRRRLFWMIYVLDRYATVATAFEFALDEREIDRKLPCRDDFFNRNQAVETRWFMTAEKNRFSFEKQENLGPFSYYVEVIGLLSRIHQFLKKPVDISSMEDVGKWQSEYKQLDGALNTWKYGLPQEYGNFVHSLVGANKPLSSAYCGWIILHAAHNTTVIRLHSSAAYPTTRSPIFTPSYTASQKCLSAVENIATLVNNLQVSTVLPTLGPPFAFSLWVAARVLLVHASTIAQSVNPSIYTLVSTLRSMGTYWRVADRYATLLQRVLDEFAESQRAPPNATGERPTPNTVRILADMRRCAYDLDFLISRQPRPQNISKMPSTTPARTPQPNEVDYLDVFDFFNMPRLPVGMEDNTGAPNPASQGENSIEVNGLNIGSEFNITDFMMDANSDWFVKGQM